MLTQLQDEYSHYGKLSRTVTHIISTQVNLLKPHLGKDIDVIAEEIQSDEWPFYLDIYKTARHYIYSLMFYNIQDAFKRLVPTEYQTPVSYFIAEAMSSECIHLVNAPCTYLKHPPLKGTTRALVHCFYMDRYSTILQYRRHRYFECPDGIYLKMRQALYGDTV